MEIADFKKTIKENNPPESINELLLALWYDAKGNWDKAHTIAQDINSKDGSRIHAYLHRKEGDEWNAGYWYRRAEDSFFKGTLDEEWEILVKRFL